MGIGMIIMIKIRIAIQSWFWLWIKVVFFFIVKIFTLLKCFWYFLLEEVQNMYCISSIIEHIIMEVSPHIQTGSECALARRVNFGVFHAEPVLKHVCRWTVRQRLKCQSGRRRAHWNPNGGLQYNILIIKYSVTLSYNGISIII